MEVNIQLGTIHNELNNNSKTWCYTSNKPFTSSQINTIKQLSQTFLDQWESHGKKVKGSIQIVNSQFIVIMADPCGDDMCGRAQDASIRLIKELEQELGLVLMDRANVAIEYAGKIEVKSFVDIRRDLTNNLLSEDTIFYDGLINTKEDFEKSWKRPIKGSWLAV